MACRNITVKAIIYIIPAFFLLGADVQASELDELATTQRLLDQVQLSLDRARTVAAQSDPSNRRRYLFDYKKANEDLNTMRAGIDRYTQPSRAQPLDYGKVSGDYTRGRPLWR